MKSLHPFLAATCALLLAACASSPSTDTAPPAPRKVLLISIDGLRADALDRGLSPNLSRMAAEGVRARWMSPSYPSLTFPNHYTIVTGLRPDHHGIVHNSMDDAALGRFALSQRDAVGNGAWWGGEPIWVGAEKAGIRTATWAWPGSEAPIQGIQPSRWQPFDGKVPPEARVDTVLGWLAQDGADAPRFMTLYFDQVDHAGHDHGPQSPEYAQAIAVVDKAIGRLLDGMARERVLDTTDVIVVSDHGMASVEPGHVVAVEDMVPVEEARVVSVGQSVGIEPLPGQQAKAEARLLGAHERYDCWRKQELPARWHYGSNPRVPSIVCQMHEGWDALPRAQAEKRRGQAQGRGSHGYDPALPSMRAVFIARGPSFAVDKQLPPFDNVDVYPLLAHLVGIRPAPNDGDPQALLPALRDAAAPAGR
ncbi:ectonucleotide pyrophosphatase/phosphodiesterase [[Pseudomonas] boreopolis]|uniref:alkaline phosphatase family protein n=1 Tax=Xanthomonas boreopolis TaxID=86183 RepID=UPI003DA16ABC